MYIYHALINARSAQHINLCFYFYYDDNEEEEEVDMVLKVHKNPQAY